MTDWRRLWQPANPRPVDANALPHLRLRLLMPPIDWRASMIDWPRRPPLRAANQIQLIKSQGVHQWASPRNLPAPSRRNRAHRVATRPGRTLTQLQRVTGAVFGIPGDYCRESTASRCPATKACGPRGRGSFLGLGWPPVEAARAFYDRGPGAEQGRAGSARGRARPGAGAGYPGLRQRDPCESLGVPGPGGRPCRRSDFGARAELAALTFGDAFSFEELAESSFDNTFHRFIEMHSAVTEFLDQFGREPNCDGHAVSGFHKRLGSRGGRRVAPVYPQPGRIIGCEPRPPQPWGSFA